MFARLAARSHPIGKLLDQLKSIARASLDLEEMGPGQGVILGSTALSIRFPGTKKGSKNSSVDRMVRICRLTRIFKQHYKLYPIGLFSLDRAKTYFLKA